MAIPAGAYVQILNDAHAGKIDGQVERSPTYWIEVTKGGSGYFAVMLWDGMGFPEPWETGIGRYETAAQAESEAENWAEAEGVSFRKNGKF